MAGYIVIEGNRRIRALHLLLGPDLASRRLVAGFRGAAKTAKAAGNVPKKVDCVVFPNWGSTDTWLRLRHLGAQGGEGVDPWGIAAQARYAAGRPIA